MQELFQSDLTASVMSKNMPKSDKDKSSLLGGSQCCYEVKMWQKESPQKVKAPSRP